MQPLVQLGISNNLPDDIHRLRQMTEKDLTATCGANASKVLSSIRSFPFITAKYWIQPIIRDVLRITLEFSADFEWRSKIHGSSVAFWIWIEDSISEYILQSELVYFTKDTPVKRLVFHVPVSSPLPSKLHCRIVSDKWLGSESLITMSLNHLKMPEITKKYLELLPVDPLPVKALGNPSFESFFSFQYFGSIESQMFYMLYHDKCNALVCSSDTHCGAELALFGSLGHTNLQIVYIAFSRDLVERKKEAWKIFKTRVVFCTPEKFEKKSNDPSFNWNSFSLLIIDNLEMLETKAGAILEYIVCKTLRHSEARIVAFSLPISNAQSVANWIKVSPKGLFNFNPNLRCIPLEVRIEGLSEKNFGSRMATMTKNVFNCINELSPQKSVLIFVTSIKQVISTFKGLIAYSAMDSRYKRTHELLLVNNQNLRLALSFGIGLLHSQLDQDDRETVRNLFEQDQIQLCIVTNDLSYSLGLKAHHVIIKGTERNKTTSDLCY